MSWQRQLGQPIVSSRKTGDLQETDVLFVSESVGFLLLYYYTLLQVL